MQKTRERKRLNSMGNYYCDVCGQELQFREIGGVTRPLHLSPCRPDSQSSVYRGVRSREKLCRQTKCPECRSAVYFVRHNNGSLWVDELGWPWPKHACMETDAPPLVSYRRLEEMHAKEGGAVMGLVVDTEPSPAGDGFLLHFLIPPHVRCRWVVDDSAADLVNNLMIFSPRRKVLIDERGKEFRLNNPPHRCPLCEEWIPDSRYTQHIRVDHRGELRWLDV